MGSLCSMKYLKSFRTVMVDFSGLESYLRQSFEEEFLVGAVDLSLVRDRISSPRLMSFGVRAFSHGGLSLVGDSYLDQHTMLCDGLQKTSAISLDEWSLISDRVEYVDSYDFRDPTVMKLQVWSVSPRSLDPFAMALGVALSYKRSELIAESRISLALDELVSRWGYFTDDF